MKKLNGITDVFFDLDHTLWDFEKNSALTFRKIFGLNHIEVNPDEFLEHYVPINFAYWKLYREEKIEKDALRFARLDDTFKALKTSVEPKKIHKLSSDYIAHLTSFNHLVADAVSILNYLGGKYQLHIITNGFDEVQHSKLNKSKIAHYFRTITNSEIAGVKKPNPKIFQYALNQAKTEAGQSIMIGDSLEADIEGALNVGMDAIFYAPNSTDINGEVRHISSLTELKHYL
ncbi:noncanonical pyrimidine nucleotidase, YjjG family [Hyunsoonleella sp. SJ7]|uniref:Noncanonical pyrimidine nucleotidase, YjjG family n=1 Tax=Hyunsoonleella aquatilis TaxID=2762758 RepID=A0A923KHY0_9FLAO|nr:YjjG family noncanonical pyrimidine nucleotidase [Hyunsoonleella aquatilis]MBC3757554.1 noncanonical pyrimidine nucleotidase, YjjG family [Hyunsoonleella aquatilis]